MRRFDRHGRRGFSLVELIVVVGLMGMLATISIGGYFAASRGMAARGVMQDTASLIRQTMQACLIDQTPTAVLFMNQRIATQKGGVTESFICGKAVAIKMAGRISCIARGGCRKSDGGTVSGTVLIDEFADWNQSYSVSASDETKDQGIRLYRMHSSEGTVESILSRGYEKCSSLMRSWVAYKEFDSDYMIATGRRVDEWCDEYNKTAAGNAAYAGSSSLTGNNCRWGLPFHPANRGVSETEWRVGDAYGIEIAQLSLPKNYIFGKSAPRNNGLESLNGYVLVFTPDKAGSVTSDPFGFTGFKNVDISVINDVEGNSVVPIGVINKEMLKDQ